MANPVFIKIILVLYLVSPFSIAKSLIKANLLIFIIYTVIFPLTYHLIIFFTLPRSFILYSLNSNFFNISKIIIIFDARRKLSIYTLMILVLFLNC